MKYSRTGLTASIGCLLLSALLLFWNPYSDVSGQQATIMIITVMVITPAVIGVIASIIKKRLMMLIVLVWSTPYCFYLSIVKIPSLWNLYALVLALYLVAIFTMKRG